MEDKKEYYNVTQLFEMCIGKKLPFVFITIEVRQKMAL